MFLKETSSLPRGEHCWLLPMFARPSIPALSLVSSNLLQDSVDIHRVHSDHGVYMLAKNFMQDDMLETWKHGHVPSHNYFSSLMLCRISFKHNRR